MFNDTVQRIADLADLLDEPMRETLWEYAELLYIQQVAFDDGPEVRYTVHVPESIGGMSLGL